MMPNGRLSRVFLSAPAFTVKTTSASPVSWLDSFGNALTTPYALRTADGKYAKFTVTDYDPGAGRVTIKYLYQHDGSRNLNSLTD